METHAQTLSESNLWGTTAVIFVLLGTLPYPFTRLISAVDNWARLANEKVIAQTGHTPTIGLKIECHAFVDHSQIMEWIDKAEVVISQGGFGSLKDCLTAGKPTIAVPRCPELGETLAEQAELVNALATEGKVLVLDNMENLAGTIETARRMKVRPGTAGHIPEIVAAEVEKALSKYIK